MTEKRFTIKPQDDLFGVVDNYSADKICVINGIHTEIEAEWLCKDMNALNDENEQLKQSNERIIKDIDLALGFIKHKGYSLQDIKDYEDAKKEYEEDLANYRKGDVE